MQFFLLEASSRCLGSSHKNLLDWSFSSLVIHSPIIQLHMKLCLPSLAWDNRISGQSCCVESFLEEQHVGAGDTCSREQRPEQTPAQQSRFPIYLNPIYKGVLNTCPSSTTEITRDFLFSTAASRQLQVFHEISPDGLLERC